MLMNINEAAVGLEDGLGLDGDRCIRVIPRHVQPLGRHPPWTDTHPRQTLPLGRRYASYWNAFLFNIISIYLKFVHTDRTDLGRCNLSIILGVLDCCT